MNDIIPEALRRGDEYLDRMDELPVSRDQDPAVIRRHLEQYYSFTTPMPATELVDDVAGMLEDWAVQTIHPRYFGYFNPTPLPEAIAGDLLAAIYNPQLAVWSHGPAAVEMEQHVLRWLAGKFGLPLERCGAHFTTGGSEANFTAVVAALTSRLPDYARQGLAGIDERPTIYHSAAAHDSFTKICHMTGLGRDALRIVSLDEHMRMDLNALRARLEADRRAGERPVLVVATAGTTAAGIIDPLEETAAVCREFDAWFHVDAAWGGAAALSPRLRTHLQGIELADSITCDAHKWLNVTMGAGMFFCRDRRVLDETFRVSTDYMPGLTEGVVDNFVTSVQWSRRFIGLKLFLALASRGESEFAKIIELQAEIGEYLRQRLADAGWVHISDSPLPVCCVTHPRIEAGETGARPGEANSKAAEPSIEAIEMGIDAALEKVLARGQAWISKVKLGDRWALRACITSCLTTREDIDTLVAEMNAAIVA